MTSTTTYPCPICHQDISDADIQRHVNGCLDRSSPSPVHNRHHNRSHSPSLPHFRLSPSEPSSDPSSSDPDECICGLCQRTCISPDCVFLVCGHGHCRSCMQEHIRAAIRDHVPSHIACETCGVNLMDADVREVLDPEDYDKYNEALVHELVDGQRFVRCPNPACGSIMECLREPPPPPPLTPGGTPMRQYGLPVSLVSAPFKHGVQTSPVNTVNILPASSDTTPSPSHTTLRRPSSILASENTLPVPSSSPAPSHPIPIANPNVSHMLEYASSCPLQSGMSRIQPAPSLQSRSLPPMAQEAWPSGKPLSAEAVRHRDANRFRCRECSTVFCASCQEMPYHLGYTCEAFGRFRTARHCRYCGGSVDGTPSQSPLLAPRRSLPFAFPMPMIPLSLLSIPLKARRLLPITSALVPQVSDRRIPQHSKSAPLSPASPECATVCSGLECQAKAERACTRILPCGHSCCGVRDEEACLACLDPACAASHCLDTSTKPTSSSSSSLSSLPASRHTQTGEDMCTVCWETLHAAPCVRLDCGHIFHFECVRKKIRTCWSGTRITFGFLDCAVCQQPMGHPALREDLAPMLALRECVRAKAIGRLAFSGGMRKDADSTTNRWLGDPAGYAMHRFSYFLCFICRQPYFGGERVCEGEAPQHFKAHELVCGGCSGGERARCPEHGTEFIEYKCRFCCQPSVYFCWGSTHFCDSCHHRAAELKAVLSPSNSPRPGKARFPPCTCGIPHPPNGEEFCYGCSLCRITRAHKHD
eukprot:TRINITY_DN3404_c0_g1_i3.p1 TRINITY_DN3404_c0_g1~~TRINITY_DN3404_c0_g1_i3.p1  ORF type:complete len:759 (-),score=94.38 TRINITY_DN3404_c0_g1_i3:10-2286(-)